MSTSCLHPPSKQRVYSFRGTDKHRLHVCGQGVQLGAGAAVPAAALLPAGLGAGVHEAGGRAAGLQRVEADGEAPLPPRLRGQGSLLSSRPRHPGSRHGACQEVADMT